MSAPNVQYLGYFGFEDGDIQPGRIVIGPGALWLGVPPPTSTFPLNATSIVPLDVTGKPSARNSPYGTFAGMTDGPAVITVSPRITESKSDIVDAPVHAFGGADSVELQVTMKEMQYVTFLAAFPLAFTNRSGTIPEDGLSAKVVERFSFGGHSQDVPTSSVLVVVPKVGVFDQENDAQKYLTFMLYRAYNSAPTKMSIDRKKGMLLTVTFKGLADLSRVDGDLVAQLVNHTGLE